MIISNIDRYIASWFNILRLTQKPLSTNILALRNCDSGGYFTDYYVYTVSNSGGTVTITFVTERGDVPIVQFVAIRFNGIYGQPDSCVYAYNPFTLDLPFAAYQIISVFHV